MKEPGYVYILTNPSFREDWVKIGKSSRPVDVRSKELDNTAVPLPFEIFATMKTVKYDEVEKLVHKNIDRLTDLRIRQNREFFNVAPQVALDIFNDIARLIDDAEVTLYQDNTESDCTDSEDKNTTGQKLRVTGKPKSNNKKELDYTKYKLNGKGNHGKGRLALEIVKTFVQRNPTLTYDELKHVIPLPISDCREIQLRKETSSDKAKDTRWFEKHGDLMKSADGIEFAFTTQVGSNNIELMIEFGKEQGFSIEPLS